jgi:heme/copper-type cytochrome/quinol oxidase subunit 2
MIGNKALLFALLAFSPGGLAPSARAAEPLKITIQDHVFHPSEIHFPADQKIEIVVENLDATAEEFESPGLKIEKVVPAKSQVTLRIRPTAHGRYTFVGEYHEKTARGQAVVE